jgi:hypothetical protein
VSVSREGGKERPGRPAGGKGSLFTQSAPYLDGQAVAEGDLFPLESMRVAGFSRSRSGVSFLC